MLALAAREGWAVVPRGNGALMALGSVPERVDVILGLAKMHSVVEHAPGDLTVTVGDQGNGFDLSSVPDPLAEENLLHHSGRGILLIRAFVDEYSVRRLSPAGTEVKLVKYLTQES